MITTIKELHHYIEEDKKRNIVNCSKSYLLFEPLLAIFGVVRESYYVRKYLRTLRRLEYSYHRVGKKVYRTIKWKRLSNKYQIYIHPSLQRRHFGTLPKYGRLLHCYFRCCNR